jgi:hypothetical protein
MEGVMSKEAERLKESLSKLNNRLKEMGPAEFVEFQPIGDLIVYVQREGNSEPNFIKNLITVTNALVRARKNPGNTLKDLPMLPYDLWLPFKANGAASIPAEALNEAAQIFDDGLKEIASRWGQIAGLLPTNAPTKPADQELLKLRDCLLDHFEYCNNWYSVHFGKNKKFFNPSDEAFKELFFRMIPTPVANSREFGSFIISLYRVFDEGMPKEIRQWKQHKQELSPPLLKVASEIFESESYNQFEILRHKFAVHDQEGLASTMAPIFHNLIGERVIARDDASKFLALQKALLTLLSEVLGQVRVVFNSSQDIQGKN